ncbi:MAG: helix-turn-helix domain-containing protein [Spirochaetaceae bacterium]|jgi:cytoskeletal protein RodZ|nr:helix-turn-helix domain-containing protein [Spirochaetaceae bacterium]
MDSPGEKLRSARESKGLDFEYVGRETNIARRYLEALETEDFSQFPGEPYILGFMRNYGDYLGLDVEELISLYRSLRIQEQPIPVEELLLPRKQFPKGLAIGIVIFVLAGILGGSVYGILRFIPRPAPVQVVEERKPVEYTLDARYLERRFYVGDSVLVPLGTERFKMELLSLNDGARIGSPLGDVALDLSGEESVDLDGDNIGDLRVILSDYSRGDASRGGLLRFELLPDELAAESAEVLPQGQTVPAPEQPATTAAAAATAAAAPIFSSPSAYPFTLQATFTGYCMFRWESDRRSREEMYFHRADVQNIQAQNGIRLWVSNASAVRLQVIGGGRTVDLDVGGPGEVAVADLRWLRDDDGRFRLALIKLD